MVLFSHPPSPVGSIDNGKCERKIHTRQLLHKTVLLAPTCQTSPSAPSSVSLLLYKAATMMFVLKVR
jgi:hypothetical protein